MYQNSCFEVKRMAQEDLLVEKHGMCKIPPNRQLPETMNDLSCVALAKQCLPSEVFTTPGLSGIAR